jgi:hypothetical protein
MRRPPWKLKKAIELEPNFGIAYYNLAVNNAYLNRLDVAQKVLQGATNRGLRAEEFLMLAYDIAFLKTDVAGMEQIAHTGSGGDRTGKLDLE